MALLTRTSSVLSPYLVNFLCYWVVVIIAMALANTVLAGTGGWRISYSTDYGGSSYVRVSDKYSSLHYRIGGQYGYPSYRRDPYQSGYWLRDRYYVSPGRVFLRDKHRINKHKINKHRNRHRANKMDDRRGRHRGQHWRQYRYRSPFRHDRHSSTRHGSRQGGQRY